MAIKGKGKTRGRRVVAAPPRPQLMIKKLPVWRRPLTWIVVAVLVLGSIGFGVWKSLSDRSKERQLTEGIAAVERYATLVSGHYPVDQKDLGGGTFLVFTTASPNLDKLQKGQLSAKQAKTLAKSFGAEAKKSADGIGAVDVTKVIPSTLPFGETPTLRSPGLTRLTLNDSEQYMVQAFKLYGDVAALISAAADAPIGAKRTAIIDQAKSVLESAGALFQRGYIQIVNIQSVLGIQPKIPTVPGVGSSP